MSTVGFWGKLDPRIKMACVLSLSAAVTLTPARQYRKLFGYGLLVVLLALISKVRWKKFFTRILFLAPMMTFLAISLLLWAHSRWDERVLTLWNLGAKTILTMCGLSILAITVPFHHLMKALESMRLPKMITEMLGFAYRYLFLFIEEAKRLLTAKKSRSIGKIRIWREWKTSISIASVFFPRVLDRSQTIYLAMLSRGYAGTLPNSITLHLARCDYLFGFFFHLLLALMVVAL
jgi:cobalt/nickel transport system permease protein